MNCIVKNIPNSITCLNLAAGVMAILCASHGADELWGLQAYNWAYIFIAIAAVADFCDGFAARLLHAYSNLGKELDSLCDLVSFGVAPAIILFNCLDANCTTEWVKWCSILIPVCGALRLARFNIDDRQTTSFIGLPIPANAIFWIGFTSLCYQGIEFASLWHVALVAIIMISWLMISPVKLFSLKFKTYGWQGNQFRWLLIATAPTLLILFGTPGLMWLIIAYVAYGIVENYTK